MNLHILKTTVMMESHIAILVASVFLICFADETPDSDNQRQGKDLIYEAMKMRTGNWPSWDRNRVEMVGGGILEKKMLGESQIGIQEYEDPQHESREMQCCDDLAIESFGELLECHPYVIGDYRKIGSCKGKSFYQHKNNTDIFLYHACGAWYIGLEIGVCGGWVLAKSNEICASSRHESTWKFYNDGVLREDPTFQVLEKCVFNSDFYPVPITTPVPQVWQQQLQPQPQVQQSAWPSGYPQYFPGSATQSTFSQKPSSTSVKHEHYHYHYPTKDSHYSGNHPPSPTSFINDNGRNGIGQIEVFSRPIEISSAKSQYKNQYKGDPYKKRADDDGPYFPINDPSDEKTTEIEDKNSRKIE